MSLTIIQRQLRINVIHTPQTTTIHGHRPSHQLRILRRRLIRNYEILLFDILALSPTLLRLLLLVVVDNRCHLLDAVIDAGVVVDQNEAIQLDNYDGGDSFVD
jgi:ADP-glucose pyrophosphorylase